MRYALIKNNAVVKTREMADNFDPAEVAHKFDFRIVNVQPNPVFDPDTHKLLGWDYVINVDSVDATPAVVALTQAEIDARTEAATDTDERETAKTFYAALVAGTATNAQVQRVVARLLKDAYLGL